MTAGELKTYYDIVVVGGGIQGAGIALLARAAGYSVLLVEKNRWASGTSSKSSKLIHGGLRYLQTGQFKLVYECLAERQWMLESLPELVKPNWFYIPVYKYSHYSPWKIHLGLWLYRLLSGNTAYSQFKKVPESQWNSLSGIKQENLKAVFAYQDAQTDDASLTQAVVQRAQALGADCLEECELLSASADSENNNTVCLLLNNTKSVELACHTLVNATGPWVNDTLKRAGIESESLPVDLIQGAHLIVSPQLSAECFYLEAPQDQRAVFCLPWKGQSLIGTTEYNFKGNADDAVVTQGEIDYLRAVIKHYFPDYDFSIDDQFCGLRVLPASDKSAFFRTRDTIMHNRQHVISLYGGKLTAWRATAAKALKLIDKRFNKTSRVDLNTIF